MMVSNGETSRKPIVIDLSSDESEKEPKKKRKTQSGTIVPSSATASSSLIPQRMELAELPDRAKIEAERLARARIREEQAGVFRNEPLPTAVGSTNKFSEVAQLQPSSSVYPRSSTSTAEPKRKTEAKMYWKAELMMSYNTYHPHSPNALRAQDIVSPKEDVIKAIVSSYVVELSWLRGLFKPSTPLLVVRHHEDVGTFEVNEMPNTYLCHPPMKLTSTGKLGHGSMHVKFFIIFYKERVRIAISTGNAVEFDYERIENSIWIQDFPRLNPGSGEKKEPVLFQSQLEHLLERMGVHARFAGDLKNYNFDTAKARLVTSIQGTYPVEQASYGLAGLSNQIRALGLQSGPETTRSVELECQGSSIGSYDSSWLQTFYQSASGFFVGKPSESTELPPLKIVYPTLDTVDRSSDGRPGAGTLFCNQYSWNKKGFPKKLFADSISKRTGLIMHVKMVLGVFEDIKIQPGSKGAAKKCSQSSISQEPVIDCDAAAKGFLYMGSHNFTPAAWGKLKKPAKRKKGGDPITTLEILNWELGVIMPLKSDAEIDSLVTWQRPVKLYGHSENPDSKVPWMQEIHR